MRRTARLLSSLSPNSSPYVLADAMRAAGTQRAWIRWSPAAQKIEASHAELQPLVDFLEEDTVGDFNKHEGAFFQLGRDSSALMGAFTWWSHRGQPCGGIRLRPYETVEEYLRDGLRLAIGMGRKSALAGLWWGGGKGVICQDPEADVTDQDYRSKLMADYGRFVTSLRGCYMAAEDSGLNVDDMDKVFASTRFTTCISPSLGGSGNPSVPTALGVVCAMEAALAYRGMGTLEGKRVAIQGLGNVARPMIDYLLERGVSSIAATDISSERVAEAKANAAWADRLDARLVGLGDNSVLFDGDADVVAPCAWGGILDDETVPQIKAPIVCGAANNMLLHPSGDGGIAAQGTTYVPDFISNRMGIVNCANESYGRVGPLGSTVDPSINRHLGKDWEHSVFNVVTRCLEEAAASGETPAVAANRMADEAAQVPHPIWGHRCQDIVDALVEEEWHKGRDE